MIRHFIAAAIATLVFTTFPPNAVAQSGRLEYRVVYAAPHQLQLVLDEAGREGYACVSLARPEQDVKLPGVVVTLARQYFATTHVYSNVRHRVVRGSGSGGDFGEVIERGAAGGYRFCGLALAEVSPGPVLVAVMTPDTEPPPNGRHYASAILGNADRVARLAALGKQGFVPVAATSINDNRVVEQRNWMVVAEQTTTQPVEIVVRQRPGPDGLATAISEQSALGFVPSLVWKQGLTPIAVVMSRSSGDAARRPEVDVDTIDPSRINARSGVYIGDVAYLSDGQRVIVAIEDRSATMYTVADPLPAIGPRDYAAVSDLRALGDQLGRDRSRDRARVVSSTVRRGPRDTLLLHTVLSERAR